VAETTITEAIQEWGRSHVPTDALPAPEVLEQIPSVLHAVGEFLVGPVAKAIVAIDEADSVATVDDHNGRGRLPLPLPDDQRVIAWADYGRLTALVDELRSEMTFLLDDLQELGLRVHETARVVAQGYIPDNDWNEPRFRERRLRELGLEKVA
jgi:hypothetical protein